MSEKVKKYKNMYERKLISEAQLDKLVEKGVLTTQEKSIIIADENL